MSIEPFLNGLTGRGICVAVVDSGIHATHPHIGQVSAGIGILDDGSEHDDWIDRLGHGTAVAAAIQEKAPDAVILPVKIFSDSLAARAASLARAIEWASDHGAQVINLSLGTRQPELAAALERAVRHARDRRSLVVAAREHDGCAWYPGSLDGVLQVRLDWGCPRAEYRVAEGPSTSLGAGPVFCASGYPREIPGVPRERNLKGISFAVANVTGFVARALERAPDATLDGVAALLCDAAARAAQPG